MAAPKLESFRRGSMFDGSFRRGSMFDGSFRQSIKDRLIPQHTRGYSYVNEDGIPNEDTTSVRCCSYRYFSDKITALVKKSQDVLDTAWKMGTSDPRKIIFSAKMGLALTLTSILIFFKIPGLELSSHYLWAILTVVVIFEFSIGATFSKGCNRGLGTLSAGGLALGMAWISEKTGNWAEVFNASSIFVVAFFATYAKLYPTLKAYEYGFRVFLLTYCYVIVSGYKTGEFMDTAVSRFLLIALGACIGLVVNTCIYPIWAGEDLHNLVAKNFVNVATSLEGCVNAYLDCVAYDTIPSRILVYAAVTEDPVYSGYRSAVQSTSQEDTLMGFASWEPPHGPYKSFRYPWAMYVKVGGALRHCAFMVMALHGCILSEIQAAEDRRQEFRNELQRVGIEGAKVLRYIGEKLKKMEKLNPIIDILHEVHQAAEELQSKIDKKSYLLVNAKNWEIGNRDREGSSDEHKISNLDGDLTRILAHKSQSEATLRPPPNWDAVTTAKNFNYATMYPHQQSRTVIQTQPSWPSRISIMQGSMLQPPMEEASEMFVSASNLSLATFASLLIEFVARLDNLVNAYDELSVKANFNEAVTD
ncbi:PREDICTED: putative aluminum-activated malate transporter 3 [Camelina sativa]|uniref:Aluminum-activated malate transporter 3 n=1 Tax=Camelina sativa TaxID=90675 RepID=A0ABM0WW53_CAMSA|nr:PREDICTED: putative aluminum-activated malate transporter 3 [Camelina sativa]